MLDRRATGPELMDGSGFDEQQVADTFRYLVPVNRLFGGIRPALSFFGRESRTWDRSQTYRILDVGCGAGDLAIALAKWARRGGCQVQIDAVDSHPAVVRLARQRCQAYPEIVVSRREALHLQGAGHHYVHASQFLHHFPDEQVVPLLVHLLGLCQHKLVVSDLVRSPLAYLATWVFTLVASPVFRHDARLSVKRGFKHTEVEDLLRDGGFSDFCLESHFFYRFLLIMNKAQSVQTPSH